MTSRSETAPPPPSFGAQVRSAVIWRSGTQIFSQLVAWASTFLVIRILSPSDYGLFAMTSVVLVLLSLLNGQGFANAAIQQRDGGPQQLRQLFGLLLVVNVGLAALQVLAAPLVAAYYRQPMVADLLRVQALIYLTNPFLALGTTVLCREMDFRKQAQVNVLSALTGAVAALAGALGGLGVWTLVLAPLTSFAVRGFGMAIAARALVWPSFDFRGTGALAAYGGTVMAGQIFWFTQTQADIVIAGRAFSPQELGYYTTALFLAQIFVTKVVPPLNEVAFSAYAQIQDDRAAVSAGFLKSVRLIMTLAMPFCLGLAAVAEPAVRVMLGDKWLPAAPVVSLLALAMPFMTLHVLFGPAASALGRPGLSTRSAIVGSVLMPVCYLVGVNHGPIGIAIAWLVAWPVLTLLSAVWTLPVIGLSPRALGEGLLPPILAGTAMGLGVMLLDRLLPALPQALRLALLVAAGGAIYGLWLLRFARGRLDELLALALRR
ncbi:lipopolysaccharide biosynthesis protein [Novosphingobium sp.]|uniref:lipopolysaccharide biosynthesis protein n=1 Tax=Novosphingobium sp. TaxID=1874826 RepID=UPI001EC4C725|nr:lipopolysaccharide biosynthesis protein [Novosphingobium sp.]MBK6802016.1 lipopolysaccharide biosynthesis protein [Novosphingobium sp.]MBK9009374.1 lipopolysaccharide biosynthesis protein [Novosphingobium sp.]